MVALNIIYKGLSGEECKTMLLTTILIGVVAIIFIIMCLCRVSGMADEQSENIYRDTHRGDDNGDN